ncbi:MAG TPA: hypothetical protein VFA04_25700 [Bryobacteraceae bacterium]|nr:hypothetical protein [Bryobacteraceae bacterium]
MRSFLCTVSALTVLTFVAAAAETPNRAWELEKQGDSAGALELLQKNAGSSAADAVALAEFLDRHRDPGARAAWQKALDMASGPEKVAAARRLVILDLIAGDAKSAQQHFAAYQEAGGRDLTLPDAAADQQTAAPTRLVSIPGPLRSFARMAALSPDLPLNEIVPALARNIVTNGYQAATSNEALEQTEYLKLVIRYLSQARELSALAGKEGVIRIKSCDSTQTADLLRVLGYRVRGACGSDLVLETVNATRAFLTIDSGFPLALLEQSLRTNRPFEYHYKPSQVAVLYGPEYWTAARDRQTSGDFVDFMIGDPSMCRLYLAMAKLEPSTAEQMRKAIPAQRLRLYAHVLDFYGSMFEIRNGRAVVPGGARSERMWGDLAGASPDNGPNFFFHLIAKDDGWLASYFDALSRITGPVQDYLTQPARLQRFYTAIRGRVTSPGPARPVFRANTDMLLLTSRLRMDSAGRPAIPGGIDVWRNLFVHHPHGKYDAKLAKAATGWQTPDDVLEALFALCRKNVENEPLKIFMAVSDVDRYRSQPLDPGTVELLVRNWRDLGAQYAIFAEVSDVSPANIRQFLDTASGILHIGDVDLRADTAGSLQALVGLWQICWRHGSLSGADVNTTFATILSRFGNIHDERTLFDSSRAGVKALLAATHSPADVPVQDRMLDLLAGSARESDVHTEMVQDMIRVFEAQRLISLTDLFALSDNLDGLARGQKNDMALVNKAAARISEIQLPQASLSTAERNSLSFGYWSEKHLDRERKMNLRAMVDRAAADPKKLEEIRADLAPLLRDTLVGLNYIYYAPPGAQILITNPIFVRSHDFIGLSGAAQTWKATDVQGGGWPSSAGGKLIGSLADLPYALAQAEQNFLIPSREQALIWGDLVPQLLTSATVARWWNVTPAQLHWVGLHMDYGETLFAEAAMNRSRLETLDHTLAEYATPARVSRVRMLLEQGRVRSALDEVTPSELFDVAHAAAFADGASDPLARDIVRLSKESPEQVNYETISRLFGTPKPTLTNSFSPRLLHLRTFPALMGYSSRILAESWESDLLYYAALADQMHLQPAELNVMIPSWTEETVENIFATHLEDWPALLRSLRSVGENAVQKSRSQAASLGGGE